MSLSICALTIALLFPTFAGGSAVTAPQKKSDPCPNALTQSEINRCAAEQFKKADEKLNGVYKRIVDKLESPNRANLVEAQRAWLKYRDANCLADRQFHGGSMAPTIEAFCLQDVTETRTRELIRIYETEAGG